MNQDKNKDFGNRKTIEVRYVIKSIRLIFFILSKNKVDMNSSEKN